MPRFSKGVRSASASSGDFMLLSDNEKHRLAMSLLEEFGAKNITEHGDEIIHSCCLPFGGHRNGDAHPSASLNWRKLVYHCHGCDGSGSIVWFAAVCRGESIEAMRQWAADLRSLDSPESVESFMTYLRAMYARQGRSNDRPIPHFPLSVLEPWEALQPDQRGSLYLEMRHVPRDNVAKHHVGYDAEADRIVLPHFWEGALVGWQKRRLVDDGGPKYKNTPDFPKDRTLYNPIVETPALVVVESVFTVVAKSHIPEHTFVSTFGASVTTRQMSLLSDYNKRIILWFDNDKPGYNATRNVGEYLRQYTSVYVVDSPWNEDAGGLDDDTVVDLLSKPVPLHKWHPPADVKEWSP